MSTASSFVCV